jgi:glycosyltransferase involved in cell wall biosynthesis
LKKIEGKYQDFEDVTFENENAPLIVLDVQCLRNKTYNRGIGRYTLSLARSLAESAPHLNFLLFASNIGDEENLPKVKTYVENLNLSNIKFSILDFFADKAMVSQAATELILLETIKRRKPSCLIVPSHFEHPFDAVHVYPTKGLDIFVIIHDIIPWRFKKDLLPTRHRKKFYESRLKELSKYSGLLAVSNFTASDVKKEIPHTPNINVIGGAGFENSPTNNTLKLEQKFGIFTVGADTPHKNINRLMHAYSLLPKRVQDRHPLTIAGLHSNSVQKMARQEAAKFNIELALPGLLSDQKMRKLYENARLVVVPSLAEGLSMPVIEGWSAGTVAIGSKGTVLEEVISNQELLFDPYSPEDMAAVMNRLLTNDELWLRMLKKSLSRLKIFNWDVVAKNTLRTIK